MKIIFFGSSDFAVPVLQALKGKEQALLVVTQPDRKKGRSLKPVPTPIKDEASKLGIKVHQPADVNSQDSIAYLKSLGAELFVVVSFGQILSKELLEIPKLYAVNIHASNLPKYRGAAPINWAIVNGESETGITIIKMNEKMDEGKILLKEAVSIKKDDDAIMLSDKLSQKSAQVILKAIDGIKKGDAKFIEQNEADATYAPKLQKEHGLIDWQMSSEEIFNRIRAFVPWPGCFTYWNKKILKIWKAAPEEGVSGKDVSPGRVIDVAKDSILVGTGKAAIRIEELQLESKRRMKVEEFIVGHSDMKSGVTFSLQR